MLLITLSDGQEGVVTVTEGEANLTVIAESGATVVVSRVDDSNSTEHTIGAWNQFTALEETRTVTPVDWPHYLVSVTGGDCRVALI